MREQLTASQKENNTFAVAFWKKQLKALETAAK